MRRKPGITSVFLLIGLLLFPSLAPGLVAQTAPPPPQQTAPPPPPTPQQLDQLLAPIALYPDQLLAQITTASTNPQEILDVTNWLAQNPSLTGAALTDAAQKQGFDPAFLALVAFPTVLQMMADHIDDYAAIGQAMSANQAEVAASIQRLRSQAYAAGALRTNQQQKVEVQQVSNQPVYVIQPANPQIVYVPQYNPTVVYVAPSTSTVVATSLITFGVGIGIGFLIANNQPWGWGGWGWGWGHGVYYNRGPWGGVWVGGYRPPSIWYHPRPPYYAGYPGYGGNWHYRPPNYRPPYPTQRPVYRPPSHYPGNPGYRPPANRPPGYRPPTNNPGYRPPTNQPGNGNRPGTQPGNGNRPGTPNNRPNPGAPPNGSQPGQTRPAPTPKPSPQTRPAPQNRPPTQQTRPAPQNKPATPQNRPAPQPKPANSGGNRGAQGLGGQGQGQPRGGGNPNPR
jgi:Protein of unknown function (DUF3300)